MLVEELSKLTNNFSTSVKSTNEKNISDLRKIVNDLKKTQKRFYKTNG